MSIFSGSSCQRITSTEIHRNMSVNHYYSSGLPEVDPSAAADGWWSQSQSHGMTVSPPPNRDRSFMTHGGGICAPFSFNLNLMNDEDEEMVDVAGDRDRQLLFEKPLTPSDVGKLNRLVIPKQHAERNFPMNCGADSCENGVLLNFIDDIGKSWRFRYSYWNSSQSYVLTKGWSRFVKEKRLDAGDVVTFSRHRVSTGRLFIGWRRRTQNGDNGGGRSREIFAQSHPHKNSGPSSISVAGSSSSPGPQNQAVTGNSKRLRLFGVNLEFHGGDEDSEASTPVESPISGPPHLEPYHHQYCANHMDMISFSGGGAGDSVSAGAARIRRSSGGRRSDSPKF